MTDPTDQPVVAEEQPRPSSRTPFIIMASFVAGLALLIALNWN